MRKHIFNKHAEKVDEVKKEVGHGDTFCHKCLSATHACALMQIKIQRRSVRKVLYELYVSVLEGLCHVKVEIFLNIQHVINYLKLLFIQLLLLQKLSFRSVFTTAT